MYFNVFYETQFHESIAVLGSAPELGRWKEYKYHLEWTEGHVWRSKEPFYTNSQFFKYKYILLKHGKFVKYERGIDRIADLEIS